MKKFFIITFIFIIVLVFFNYKSRESKFYIPPNIYKIIDFNKNSNPKALDIVKVINNDKHLDKNYELKAYFTDLNNDNNDEIVSLIKMKNIKPNQYIITIHELNNDKPKNLWTFITYNSPENLYIINHFTNGYRDLLQYYLKDNETYKLNINFSSKYKFYNSEFEKSNINILKKKQIKIPKNSTIYYLTETNNSEAKQILYQFAIKDLKQYLNDDDIAKLKNNLDIYADFIDLNDDGINEIIGIVSSSFYGGKIGIKLFILSKYADEYKDLNTEIYIQPNYKIYILKHKSNGYKDIIVFGGIDASPVLGRFNGNFYTQKYLKK